VIYRWYLVSQIADKTAGEDWSYKDGTWRATLFLD